MFLARFIWSKMPRWGASVDEVNQALPGDDLVAAAPYRTTRAATIEAPPSMVWPWLVQMGLGRGGLYTYDGLENLLGLGYHSADEIVPQWQKLTVDDHVRIAPETPLRVEICEVERDLVLHTVMSPYTAKEVTREASAWVDWSWAFHLSPSGVGETRLIVRTRAEYRPSWLRLPFTVLLEPIHYCMERGMILGIKARAEALQSEIAGLATQRGTHAESLRPAEQSIQALRKEAHSLGEQCGREEVHATQVELRLENTAETCHERHGVELATFEQDIHALRLAIESQRKAMRRRASAAAAAGADGEAPAAETEAPAPPADEAEALPHDEEGPDWAFVESIVGELRQRLEAMGPVNLDAITEFEELEERHNFLQAQNDDLVKSKQELLEIIEHINKETRIRFTETFEQVRENFGRMFKTLFGERAQANLILLDEGDPLESGIEISAKPPGKKLQSISLLSGGERSLTAVALLFSIYLVKPSPFCVLDELDAPLDESNIGRFLKVLDSFIDKSQFIIVTHSKRTMARADVMYGVTMEEFGVSKPVGMRLTKEEVAADPEEWGGEAEEKPEEDLTAAERAARELEG